MQNIIGGRGRLFRCIIVVLSVIQPPRTTAQSSGQSERQSYSSLNGNVKVSPVMAIILVCLIAAFFIMGCVAIYLRHCTQMGDNVTDEDEAAAIRRRRSNAHGLDPSIIDTFPMFLYSVVKGHKIGKGALECAVCLNEFEDDETLRLLPKCCHVFHPDCIDAWLASHVTCPVCRANLVPKAGETGTFSIPSQESVIQSDDSTSLQPPEVNGNANPVNEVNDSVIDIIDMGSGADANGTTTENDRQLHKVVNNRKFPRSHSTGHSLIQPGEDCERFTLRLPEEFRNRLINTAELRRAKSSEPFLSSRSSRKGYRSRSTSGTAVRGGKYTYYERFDQDQGRTADRWGLMTTPPFSSRAGSTRSQGTSMAGEDNLATHPKSLYRSVRSPFEKLFRGVERNDDVGERSSDRLTSHVPSLD